MVKRSRPSFRPPLQDLSPLSSLLSGVRTGAAMHSGCRVDRESWRLILGDRIAQRSEPEALQGQTLSVRVASSVWAQELSLLAPEIIQRLQRAGFSVSELRWHVSKLGRTTRPRIVGKTVVPLQRLPAELERALGAVEDPELRNAIFEAASHLLARQQQVLPNEITNAKRPSAPAPRCVEPRTYRPGPSDRD